MMCCLRDMNDDEDEGLVFGGDFSLFLLFFLHKYLFILNFYMMIEVDKMYPFIILDKFFMQGMHPQVGSTEAWEYLTPL